jgi:hypothetical protein
MCFRCTAIVRIDPRFQVGGTQQPLGIRDRPLAMDPRRLAWIAPRALGGQPTGDDPHALPAALDGAVMGAPPGSNRLAGGPRGVLPDHEQGRHPLGGHTVATPGENRCGDGPDRASLHNPPPPRLARAQGVPDQPPITGHRLRIGIGGGPLHRLPLGDRLGFCPAVRVRLRQPPPPHCIGPAPGPGGVRLEAVDQASAPVFFRT